MRALRLQNVVAEELSLPSIRKTGYLALGVIAGSGGLDAWLEYQPNAAVRHIRRYRHRPTWIGKPRRFRPLRTGDAGEPDEPEKCRDQPAAGARSRLPGK